MKTFQEDMMLGIDSSAPPASVVEQYTQSIINRKCGEHNILAKTLNPVTVFNHFSTKGIVSALAVCGVCKIKRCIGCGTALSKGVDRSNNVIDIPGIAKIDLCCEKGKTFILWVLLCGLDALIAPRRTTAARSEQQQSSASRSGRLDSHASYGRSRRTSSGTGFARSDIWMEIFEHPGCHEGVQSLKNTPDQQRDNMTGDVLTMIVRILPQTAQSCGLIMLAMIRCSYLIDRIAELLKNDSIANIVVREKMYVPVIKFAQVLASDATLVSTVVAERLVKKQGISLIEIAGGEIAPFKMSKDGQIEKAQSVAAGLTNLKANAAVIMKNAAAYQTSPAEQKTVRACQSIMGLASALEKAGGRTAGSYISTANITTSRDPQRVWETWHRANCIIELPDASFRNHAFITEAMHITAAPRSRMPKLIEQTGMLQTSLPPGIFVRYASSRPDTFKALIVGPTGTPYSHGAFVFDILCPAAYLRMPPQVLLRTTGGGRVAFGPNLYREGKVCLSLLGTWSGQPWIPGESTLLQVLVSVQSMIFVDHPLQCEPGWEKQSVWGDWRPMSRWYNAQLQVATCLHAIVEPLAGRRGDAVFGEVLARHFHVNATAILATVRRWETELNAGGPRKGARVVINAVPYAPNDLPGAARRVTAAVGEFLKTAKEEIEALDRLAMQRR